jgi:prefoldin subunit 5
MDVTISGCKSLNNKIKKLKERILHIDEEIKELEDRRWLMECEMDNLLLEKLDEK